MSVQIYPFSRHGRDALRPFSNFASKHQYVIQGFDNTLDKWTDSKYGAATYMAAQNLIPKLIAQKVFLENTKTRVAYARYKIK